MIQCNVFEIFYSTFTFTCQQPKKNQFINCFNMYTVLLKFWEMFQKVKCWGISFQFFNSPKFARNTRVKHENAWTARIAWKAQKAVNNGSASTQWINMWKTGMWRQIAKLKILTLKWKFAAKLGIILNNVRDLKTVEGVFQRTYAGFQVIH